MQITKGFLMSKDDFTNKKVLFTSHKAGFANTFNRPLIKLLRDAGAEVHYASNGDQYAQNCDKQFKLSINRSPFTLNNIKAYRQLKNIIETEKYDMIHCHTPTGGVVTRLAARRARKNGTRVIYTAHGFHFFKGAPLLNWLIYYPIEKIMANITDTLITINNEDFEIAKSKFKTDVRYVPGVGIDPKKFDIKMTKQQKTELRKSLGLADNDFVMIYPAELNKNKNQLWLINSLSELIKNDPKLHLLLPGQDSLSGKCQNLVNKLGLENNVHFLGYRTDMVQLFKISNLSVSSSLREGLPVNIMEAMQTGIPVITTECRGSKDLVKDGKTGFVVAIDDNSLFKDRFRKIYHNIKLQNKMAISGRLAIQNYTLNKVLPLMKEIYEVKAKQDKSTPILILQMVTIMNRGGLETMLMNYYRNIDRSKIQFDFIVHRREAGAFDEEIKSLGGNIYYLPSITLKHLPFYFKYLHKFLVEHREYKTIHCHLDSLSALPLLIAKKVGVPVRIVHSHTNNFDKNFKENIRSLAKRLIKYLATDFMGCSNGAVRFMFGNNIKNYKIINNAIEVDKFSYNPEKREVVRNDLCINKNCLVIGNVGRFDYPKNHEFLIDIFYEIYKSNKNSLLMLVGDGNGRVNIERKVKLLGLENVVRLLGVRSDIPDLMQAMDVFVMPSRYEGLPVVSIEAQASGLPCFFSDTITNEVSVTDDCHFIGLDKSPKQWANQITSIPLINRQNTVGLIRKAGFDISIESKKLFKYYKAWYDAGK